MSKAYEEQLERYRQLKEQHPDEPLRFFAEHFGVHIGTVSRWNKALKKLSIQEEAIEEIETRLRKEYEAKLQAILEDKEQEREVAARKKAEAEKRKSENRRQYLTRVLRECAQVDIYPSKTVSVTWQGHRYVLIAGEKNTVPDIIAGIWRDSQGAQREASQTIARYEAGQYLGRV